MGVLECHRDNCENIMCDTHIDNIGYICYECQEEFKNYLLAMNEDETEMTTKSIKLRLSTFMRTDKESYNDGEITSVDEFFSKYRK